MMLALPHRLYNDGSVGRCQHFLRIRSGAVGALVSNRERASSSRCGIKAQMALFGETGKKVRRLVMRGRQTSNYLGLS
jgi:hypothetical protein